MRLEIELEHRCGAKVVKRGWRAIKWLLFNGRCPECGKR